MLNFLYVSTTARHMLLDLRIWYISISAMIASGLHLPILNPQQASIEENLKNSE